jgi:flagellar protein FliJ
MKRFRFRLETVARVRQIQEEQARAQVMLANRAVALAQSTVDARQTRYETLPRPAGATSMAELEATMFRLDAAAGGLEWARGEHRAALEHAHDALAQWAQAEQRVRALDRLRDRARAEHTLATRREEDRLTDDLTTTRARMSGATA